MLLIGGLDAPLHGVLRLEARLLAVPGLRRAEAPDLVRPAAGGLLPPHAVLELQEELCLLNFILTFF